LDPVWSNAKTRSSRPTSSACSQAVNSSFRLDSASLLTPRCYSPQVIALIQISVGLRA
jgi:hypothetical protein